MREGPAVRKYIGAPWGDATKRPRARMTFIPFGRCRVWHLCEVALNLAPAVAYFMSACNSNGKWALAIPSWSCVCDTWDVQCACAVLCYLLCCTLARRDDICRYAKAGVPGLATIGLSKYWYIDILIYSCIDVLMHCFIGTYIYIYSRWNKKTDHYHYYGFICFLFSYIYIDIIILNCGESSEATVINL